MIALARGTRSNHLISLVEIVCFPYAALRWLSVWSYPPVSISHGVSGLQKYGGEERAVVHIGNTGQPNRLPAGSAMPSHVEAWLIKPPHGACRSWFPVYCYSAVRPRGNFPAPKRKTHKRSSPTACYCARFVRQCTAHPLLGFTLPSCPSHACLQEPSL